VEEDDVAEHQVEDDEVEDDDVKAESADWTVMRIPHHSTHFHLVRFLTELERQLF